MDFAPSPRAAELTALVKDFIETEIEPVEADYHHEIKRRRDAGQGEQWQELPVMKELQAKARERGLWNLFLPAGHEGPYAEKYGTLGGAGLSNVDYAPIAELTGRSFIAPYVFNCNAPDTGNMEVLLKYGSQAQKDEWLDPLLDGRIRSAFLMTEPGVASSDATNMELTRGRRRRRDRAQRPQVVLHRRRPPRLRDLHRDGPDRPRGRPPPPALDGAGPARHPRRQGRADAHRRWASSTSRTATARSR